MNNIFARTFSLVPGLSEPSSVHPKFLLFQPMVIHPIFLTRHKKKKKLMEGTRKRVLAKFKASTTKGEKAMKLKPQRFQMLPRNKRKDFENYFGGHDELQRPGGLEAYPNSWDVAPTIQSPWELFKNYGYTLEPKFALMFTCKILYMWRSTSCPLESLNHLQFWMMKMRFPDVK